MGDFYEMFYEDALVAARALELTLTSRSKDASGGAIPMCGLPYHALDTYLPRLVRKGYRVAICEQVEDPKKAKGIVRREVVRVYSPGTLVDAGSLDAREPAFLLSLVPATDRIGVALLDLSTGEFSGSEYVGADRWQTVADEVAVLRPREIVVPAGVDLDTQLPHLGRSAVTVTPLEVWYFEQSGAERTLTEQFQTRGLEGFGLTGHGAAIAAAGALVHYLRDTQKADLAHVRAIAYRQAAEAMIIDPVTLQHLEVVEAADGARTGSLLHEIDRTITPMGGRLLRNWLLRPLVALEPIQDRLDAVEALAFRATDRGRFREALKSVHDLERLVARAALGVAGPRDLVGLRQSLLAIPRARLMLDEIDAPLVKSLAGQLEDLSDVRDDIGGTLIDDPPAFARDGGMIRDGVDGELDELRTISRSGKQVIASMEERERQRTGVASLKIRFNRVFGYYIEVTKSNLHAVPDDYQRKQTIAGGERYITPALKEYEEKVLGADERILTREVELFESLRARVAAASPRIQDTARALAALDVLAGLAEQAAHANYTKPHVHDQDEMLVADGRHPVVERHSRDAFVPNDIVLDGSAHQLVVLTGPNMGGKSTYLRQTALICLLAQAGSFVPARTAKLAIVDRVFARVGASDNIARGQSTFMVEMQETASILHLATSRSLVVLDEIGRGTATFDGLSIAWAVAEYLATNTTGAAEDTVRDPLPRAHRSRRCVAWRRELPCGASASGMTTSSFCGRSCQDDPTAATASTSRGWPACRRRSSSRAREILTALEQDELARGGRPSITRTPNETPQQQLGLFQQSSPADHVAERLRSADLDRLTPLDALTLLADLKKDLADES